MYGRTSPQSDRCIVARYWIIVDTVFMWKQHVTGEQIVFV